MQKEFASKQMTDAAYVDQAAGWARALTLREARGPGDTENAWHRLEARYGIAWRILWALRYRRPQSLTAYTFNLIHSAYVAECERQARKLQHEIEITKQVSSVAHPCLDEAAALVGTNNVEEE
jgi:hypothetical protein